jgi:serine/threonine protein kinase
MAPPPVALTPRLPCPAPPRPQVKAMPPANALRMLLKLEKTRSWSQATGDADKLSAEARDLLDQIFQPEFQQRITIAGIKQHPWFTQQLPAKYADALKRQEPHIMKAMSSLQSQRASSISSMRRTQSLSQLKEDPEEEQQQAKQPLQRLPSNAQQPSAAGKEPDEQKAKAALQQQLQQQLQLSQHLQAQRQHMLSRDSPIQHLRVHDSASDISSTPTTPKNKAQGNKAVMAQVSELLDTARRIGLPGMWSGLKRVQLVPVQ